LEALLRIEDYGIIGDMHTAALVGRDGSVDWLCLPRFDSPSCFSALLGDESHGRWLLAPAGPVEDTSRRYQPGTIVLETDFETAEGAVRVIDFMPRRRDGPPRLMGIVEGLKGRVPMRMELALRPDYASITPWVEPVADGALATAGPDSLRLSTPLPLDIDHGTVRAEFVAVEGARERFALTWHLSYESSPPVEDADSALTRTEAWWREWSGRCAYRGEYRDEVLLSLRVLKAMTLETTGAVIAAPTTSLPEDLGGVRNWDYRYCWLRDSVLALEAMLVGEYTEEALAFRDFLARAGTGDPSKIHSEVCEQGYDAERMTFTQCYGSKELDASNLKIPIVGFLPGSDDRVTGTIDAIARELGRDGFVSRYSTTETDDGLAGDEGQFLACSFWLVSALALNGRIDEARALFERLLGLANDLGLFCEEYDVGRQRQVGSFPQAFSHLTLIGAARAISAGQIRPGRPSA
jgi:GH15 family glucan-1,4-alpha-glucosidase